MREITNRTEPLYPRDPTTRTFLERELFAVDPCQAWQFGVLHKIHELVQTCWCQGDMAKTKQGIFCLPTCRRAAYFCVVGAMHRALWENFAPLTHPSMQPASLEAGLWDTGTLLRAIFQVGPLVSLVSVNDLPGMTAGELSQPIHDVLDEWATRWGYTIQEVIDEQRKITAACPDSGQASSYPSGQSPVQENGLPDEERAA